MADEQEAAPAVVLVRHGRPVIDMDRPAGSWALDERAKGDVIALAKTMRSIDVDVVVTSPEEKALGTARLIAKELSVPLMQDESLREQGGGRVPWIEEPDAFRSAVEAHFRQPDHVVLGDESSSSAARRFAAAVEHARARYRTPAFVTHGRVMCAYLGMLLGRDPMTVWNDLQMPDAFMLDEKDRRLSRIDVQGDVKQ